MAANGKLALHVRMGSASVGGPERTLQALVAPLAKAGTRSAIAILDDGRTDWRRLERTLERSQTTLHSVPCHRYLDLRASRAIAALARTLGASILHTHDYKSDIQVALIRRGDVAWVTTAHGDITTTARLRLYHALARAVTRRADAATSPSPKLLERFAGDDRAHLVPSVAPLPKLPRQATQGPRLRLLTTTRLSREKGVDILIQALAKCTRDSGLQLTVLGDGTEERALHSLAQKLGIADRISWAGWQDDVGPALAAADLFVLPSRTEAQPVAMLEAMACGLPVVASRVGAVPHCIEEGRTGLLVPPGDAAALARALLAARDTAFDPGAARSHVATEHSPVAVAGQLNAVYAAASAHRRAR